MAQFMAMLARVGDGRVDEVQEWLASRETPAADMDGLHEGMAAWVSGGCATAATVAHVELLLLMLAEPRTRHRAALVAVRALRANRVTGRAALSLLAELHLLIARADPSAVSPQSGDADGVDGLMGRFEAAAQYFRQLHELLDAVLSFAPNDGMWGAVHV
jgi:hypothetical protein